MDFISIISCDKVEFILPHSIYSQFNFFLSHKKEERKDTSSFQLKFTSKALIEIIDLINEDKREELLQKFPKTCDFLQFDDYDINVNEKILKLAGKNEVIKQFSETKWDRTNIDQIDGFEFKEKCEFVRDIKKHKLETLIFPLKSTYKVTTGNIKGDIRVHLQIYPNLKIYEEKIYLEIICKVKSGDSCQKEINNRE